MSSDLETFTCDLAWKLKRAGIESPRLEARMLVAHVLGVDYQHLFHQERELSETQLFELDNLLAERLAHKPLDKVLGYRWFYKYKFEVSEAVLSPRPDTEVLVEAAIEHIKTNGLKKVLDLGTGSGCILLSIAADCLQVEGTGFDKSGEALEIAARNAYDLGVQPRIKLVEGTWYNDQLSAEVDAPFEVIVSNPPYIKSAEIEQLDREVKDFDPRIALDGGKDGLQDYRRLAKVIPPLLADNGVVFLEVGEDQAQEVAAIFCAAGMDLLRIIKDLSDIDRCVMLKKIGCN